MRSLRASALILVVVAVSAVAQTPAVDPSAVTTALAAVDSVQDVFFRRLALERILEDKALQDRLLPVSGGDRAKLKNQLPALMDQESGRIAAVVDLVAEDLGRGSAVVLEASTRAITTRPPPEDLSLVGLARTLRGRLKYERAQGSGLAAALKSADKALAAFVAARPAGSDEAARRKVASFLKKMQPYQIWPFFSSGGNAATVDKPTSEQVGVRVDLNKATAEQIATMPGMSLDLARKVVVYRDKAGGFNGLSELGRVPGIGEQTLKKLATTGYAGDFVRPQREWTVLDYAAMASNLETSGLEQMNDMEKVGSGPAMHIVRQFARGRGDTSNDRNWAGSRRYYVVKDDDPRKVTSPILGTLGDLDSGRPEALVAFCRWAIPLFPARRYWLALENHGGGPLWGYGSDDDHGSHQTLAEVGRAVAEATKILREHTGRPDARFDVISFHACMMGTVEIVDEIRPYCKVLIASESIGWGGWGWEGYLGELAKDPTISLEVFARQFAEHLKQWVARMKSWDWRSEMNLTVMAVDTDRLGPLLTAVDDLGKSLAANLPQVAESYKQAREAEDPFGDAHDLDLFCSALRSRTETSVPDVAAAARKVSDAIGHPPVEPVSGVVHGLEIRTKKAGSIIWSLNNWTDSPPEEMRPAGSRMYLQANCVKTPLSGPDDKGEYVLTFPDFDAGKLRVQQIDWRQEGPRGGLGPTRRFDRLHPDANELVTTTFGPGSPLIVEAHTQGYGASRGLALLLPLPRNPVQYRSFLETYRDSAWAKTTSWGALAEKIGKELMPDTWAPGGAAPGPPTDR